jgi:hypothetical protein
METITVTNDNFINKSGYDIISNNDNDVYDNRSDEFRSGDAPYIRKFEDRANENELPNTHMIFRFKFTQDFMDKLYVFSKIHQYDERNDFKEAWQLWVDENDEDVNAEKRRITSLGYDGDVMEKMFKSARYYFRKKTDEKKEPKERRKYISVSHDLLEAMDVHILSHIGKDDYQPKNGFILFCHENEDLLKASINVMLQQGFNDSAMIQEKIKKTYKNRYFMLSKK